MNARLVRKRSELHIYSDHRDALDTLLSETGDRCAYSMQHVMQIGRTTMEVDHFNPTRLANKNRNNAHGNLLCASRHCNGRKSNKWPSAALLRKGVRLLNPYKERDYDRHIFEDLETGEVYSDSPAGKWHIRQLCLNDPFLVEARKDRTLLARAVKQVKLLDNIEPAVIDLVKMVERVVLRKTIPAIKAGKRKK